MSFSSIPKEVICQIFSYISEIDDVGDKIRLERVSKQFRRLIQDGRSWKLNTSLDLDAFRYGDLYYDCVSDYVGSFLSHVQVINCLQFSHRADDPYDADILAQVYLHLPKLKLTSLYYMAIEKDNCDANMQFITLCLANFRSTLTKFEYECCSNGECRTLAAVVALLPLCHKLTYIDIESVDLGKIPLLDMLAGKQLAHVNFGNCRNLTAELAANLVNSVPGHTVRYFSLWNTALDLPNFLETVDPAVLGVVKGVSLFDNSNSFVQGAPKLLEMTPGLENLSWKIVVRKGSPVTTLDIAEMLHQILQHSQRQKHLEMRLTVKRAKRGEQDSFGEDLWRQICLVDSCKSGTRRALELKHWKRQLKMGNIECDVHFGSY